jgi:hypothetical protein
VLISPDQTETLAISPASGGRRGEKYQYYQEEGENKTHRPLWRTNLMEEVC